MKNNLIIFTTIIFLFIPSCTSNPPDFDASRAYQDVEYQVSLGPRSIGSEGHSVLQQYIKQELDKFAWDTEIQTSTILDGLQINNILAKRGYGADTWIILGAHYDTRLYADMDPDPMLHTEPVPGANDGASGVAVLLELGRVLPRNLDKEIWLVFFDAEDNGRIGEYDWILGSRVFVENLANYPDAVIIVDMVGDENLVLPFEQNSDRELAESIWSVASGLGRTEFVAEDGPHILDDHIPFLELGIPAVDIIDFDYPYWHTTSDTLDKISMDSLDAVGDTLLAWLLLDTP